MSDSNDPVGRGPVFASHYLQSIGKEHGDEIHAFIDKHDIGKSAYGRLMDAAGRHEAMHRLYGHHVVYDFPLQRPEAIPDFAEHLLSDAFTQTGLPLVPGQILDEANLLRYCKSLTDNWNFVNGFDVLSATVSIYRGQCRTKEAWKEMDSVESLATAAKSIGLPALETAIAMSTANPLLAVGAALNAAASIKKLVTSSSVAYFHRVNYGYRLDVQLSGRKGSIVGQSLSEDLEEHSLESTLSRHSLH
jgi:hypothetical protein